MTLPIFRAPRDDTFVLEYLEFSHESFRGCVLVGPDAPRCFGRDGAGSMAALPPTSSPSGDQGAGPSPSISMNISQTDVQSEQGSASGHHAGSNDPSHDMGVRAERAGAIFEVRASPCGNVG